MNLRNYNIYFHTHTISGIIISAMLYVIFFAGSFSFFRHEIGNWQKDHPNIENVLSKINLQELTQSLDNTYGLYGRDVSFSFSESIPDVMVYVGKSKDSTNKKEGGYFYINPLSKKTSVEYDKAYNLGEFLYELHYFEQINHIADFGFPIGYYVSGVVAFLFLFALITGLLLHWDKIISNFYIFRPWEKFKTVWTDLHTALGVISFPFLLVFAITGSYYNLNDIFSAPIKKVQYKGNQDAYYQDLGYSENRIEMQNKKLVIQPDVNIFLKKTLKRWGNVSITEISLMNYGDKSMEISIKGSAKRNNKFVSQGEAVYNVESGSLLKQRDPESPSTYSEVINELVHTLHFGNYGGLTGKILNFLLGICGCIVIISGVLIWQVARDKKNIPEKKRKFNMWLTIIYLSISLSMFPVTAIAFIAVKLNPDCSNDYIYKIFFYAWILAVVLLSLRKDIFKINRDCLLTGAFLSLSIPVINGLKTGHWLWYNFKMHYYDLLFIDLFWILTGVISFISLFLIILHQRNKNIAKVS